MKLVLQDSIVGLRSRLSGGSSGCIVIRNGIGFLAFVVGGLEGVVED